MKNHNGNGGNIHPQRSRVKTTPNPLRSWEQTAVAWTKQVICEGLEDRLKPLLTLANLFPWMSFRGVWAKTTELNYFKFEL